MKKIYSIGFAVMLFLAGGQSLLAQSSAKDKFFADYEALVNKMQADNAEVLSPENYQKAIELFEEANTAYEQKESTREIREMLEESASYAKKASEVIRMAHITLSSAIEARDAAIEAQAALYATKLWEEAEDVFARAAENLEDNDVEDAREYGLEAEQLFRQAELLAIKNGILGEARDAIAVARDLNAEELAYHTFTDAQNLLAQTERLLEGNRYAREEAIEKAERAAYQGRHAAYLAKTIKALSQKDENWENLMLKFEEILSEIGSQFNYVPEFDQGFDSSVKSIANYIRKLKDSKELLITENARLQEELSRVREKEATSSAELQKKLEREAAIEKIKSFFTPSEARVIYEGDNITIRLKGLTFPSGQYIIQPEYFSLLTKVQKALKVFPESHYTVEGHTDALGNAGKNKILSDQRARSVREYLMANMDLDENQITSIGYGEERPVASNETREGRIRNRRIDIVINLTNE